MIELEQMFDVFENTMSLHLRENLNPQVKHGNPGEWSLDPISDDILDRDYLESITITLGGVALVAELVKFAFHCERSVLLLTAVIVKFDLSRSCGAAVI